MGNPREDLSSYSYIIRQTPTLLIMRIIFIEILVMILHYILRLVLNYVLNYLAVTDTIFFMTLEVIFLQFFNLYLLLKITLLWINEYYILNPKEVIIKKGIINTQTTTYEIANLQSMTVNQSFWEKLLQYGSIRLFNPVLKEEVYLSNIPNPKKYGDIIQQHQPENFPIIRRK